MPVTTNPKLDVDFDLDLYRHRGYANYSSAALSELSGFVGLAGLVLIRGFPDFFKWLARHKKSSKVISVTLAVFLTSRRLIDQDGSFPESAKLAFQPHNAFDLFRHDGKLFLIVRDNWSVKWGDPDTTMSMRVWCIGQSTEPIKAILQEAMDTFKQEVEMKNTSIPVHNYGSYWRWAATKPRRPIGTVDSPDNLKDKLLKDIELFRQPRTKQFYRYAGIPYRRGYLFHGVPGTGKSSLAFAIAGLYDMQIYSLSLLDSSLEDKDLPTLFSRCGRRSMILLEDIDSAGLNRETESERSDKPPNNDTAVEATKGKDDKKDAKPKSKASITLSGLLNAIDGVAAPEGHILILTSNRPETLDPALVRPGQVDLSIEFTLATQDQAKDIFKRIYSYNVAEDTNLGGKMSPTADDIARLTDEFAVEVPMGLFSPAEIQDYIVVGRLGPQWAVSEAAEWVKKKQDAEREMAKQRNAKNDSDERFHDVPEDPTSPTESVSTGSSTDLTAMASDSDRRVQGVRETRRRYAVDLRLHPESSVRAYWTSDHGDRVPEPRTHHLMTPSKARGMLKMGKQLHPQKVRSRILSLQASPKESKVNGSETAKHSGLLGSAPLEK